MNAPARLSRDEAAKHARPILTKMLHRLLPGSTLIDCARLANHMIDEAVNGNMEWVEAMLAVLERVLERHGVAGHVAPLQ
jgi:hypothetical protein